MPVLQKLLAGIYIYSNIFETTVRLKIFSRQVLFVVNLGLINVFVASVWPTKRFPFLWQLTRNPDVTSRNTAINLNNKGVWLQEKSPNRFLKL